MGLSFTTWIKSKFFSKPPMAGGCTKKEECLKILQLMLDGEASDNEEKFFVEHKEHCIQCLEMFDVEKSIRDAIKTKLQKKAVPTELIESIKSKIDPLN